MRASPLPEGLVNVTTASPQPSVNVPSFMGVATLAVRELDELKLPASMSTAESRLPSVAWAMASLMW